MLIVGFDYFHNITLWLIPLQVYALILYADKKEKEEDFQQKSTNEYSYFLCVIQWLTVLVALVFGALFALLRSCSSELFYLWIIVGILMLLIWFYFSKNRFRRITFSFYALLVFPLFNSKITEDGPDFLVAIGLILIISGYIFEFFKVDIFPRLIIFGLCIVVMNIHYEIYPSVNTFLKIELKSLQQAIELATGVLLVRLILLLPPNWVKKFMKCISDATW